MQNWHKKAYALYKRHQSKKLIASKCGVSINEVNKYLSQFHIYTKTTPLEENNLEANVEKPIVFENYIPEVIKNEWDGTQTIRFGVIGDTHFNSKYCQITWLNEFYQYCKRLGVSDVYHAGDIDDGEDMRIGHKYECYTQGADDHVREIVKNYPHIEGITTHFITGNHDASVYKKCGVDIGPRIQAERPDMHYLGRDCARIELAPHCILELRHPWDGTAYALSYKPQKMMDGMEADSKPNILVIGHYHKLEYVFYRNIHCFQTGCFQMQTPFTRGKGISVHMGGWIITVKVDQNGTIKSIEPVMMPFYKGIENDYLNYH